MLSRGDLVLVVGVMAFVGTFGLNFQLTSALMATHVYDKGAGEYGILGSTMAIGSIVGRAAVRPPRAAAAAPRGLSPRWRSASRRSSSR